MESFTDRNGAITYTHKFTYEFEAAGVRGEGHRVGFFGFYDPAIKGHRDTNPAAIKALKVRYPVGRAVVVHYRPGEPEDCVLQPGPTANLYFELILRLCLLLIIILSRRGFQWVARKLVATHKTTIQEGGLI